MATWKKIITSGDIVNADLTGSAGITSGNIANAAITTAKIAADAITKAKIADNAVDEEHFNAVNAPTSGKVLGYTSDSRLDWVSNGADIILREGVTDYTVTQDTEKILFKKTGGLTISLEEPTGGGDVSVIYGTNLAASDIPTLNASKITSGSFGGSGEYTFPQDVTVTGDLTVSGDYVTMNVANLDVEDKVIKLANVATPTTTTGNGSGIEIETHAVASNFPTLKWNASGNLSGWTVTDHAVASGGAIVPMQFKSTTGEPGSDNDFLGVGSLQINTTDQLLYIRTA